LKYYKKYNIIYLSNNYFNYCNFIKLDELYDKQYLPYDADEYKYTPVDDNNNFILPHNNNDIFMNIDADILGDGNNIDKIHTNNIYKTSIYDEIRANPINSRYFS
jgi:hypothetical protein